MDDYVKSTLLYHLINLHSNVNRIDGESQTLFYDKNQKGLNKAIDLEQELKKIEDENIISYNPPLVTILSTSDLQDLLGV